MSDEKGRILDERDAVEAKLEAARAQQGEQTVIKPVDNQLLELSPVGIETILGGQGNEDAQTGTSQQFEQQQSGGETTVTTGAEQNNTGVSVGGLPEGATPITVEQASKRYQKEDLSKVDETLQAAKEREMDPEIKAEWEKQAANEQAARQGEQAKEQAANRAETSASGGVIHGGPTVSEKR